MLTHRHLEKAEALFELDPVRSYPRRATEHLKELVGASAFRLEHGDNVVESEPKPAGAPTVSIALTAEQNTIGTLHLYGIGLSEEEMSLAKFGARVLARGLRFSRRLGGDGFQRTYEDVQAMLERTPLTPRERDVVGRLLSGASTRQIAESTGLTVATVNTYLKRIFAKLGVHSRVELVARVTGTRGVIPTSAPRPE